MLSTVGTKWIIANEIFSKVGENKFYFSDLKTTDPKVRSNMRQLVDCGILSAQRIKVGRVWLPEYQLTPEAITKIRRYGD